MKHVRILRVGWILALAVSVLGITFMTPALAFNNSVQHGSRTAKQAYGSSLNAIVYLSTGSLVATFQNRIDQQIPGAVNSAIANAVSSLPARDQGWATEMATTLIQPSATLESLYPRQGGLAMSLRLSLYPGDPQAINSNMLIKFSVLNSSTAQVSAVPLNGSPSLVNGPLTTFHMPLGALNSIYSTPGCGSSALALNLQFPVALGQTASQVQPLTTNFSKTASTNRVVGNVNSFIVIPSASLSSIGSSIGTMPVSKSIKARNIRIVVQGNNIHILSDIYWSGINIGTADSAISPGAAGGNLVLYVLSTNLNIFNLFSFPLNSYNKQIQRTLNAKLGNALNGKFYVAQAGIGPGGLMPCAAGDSLVLAGNISALG